MIHNFATKLAQSQNPNNEEWWEQVYRQAFPNFVCFMPIVGDCDLQRKGSDRAVALTKGPLLHFDEKMRFGEYDDILLEYESNDRTHAPGWIEKDLEIHYITYAFMTTGVVYFFPWALLRRTWKHHKQQWMQDAREERNGFAIIPGRNETYTTWNVAVPIPTLISAIAATAAAGVLKVKVQR